MPPAEVTPVRSDGEEKTADCERYARDNRDARLRRPSDAPYVHDRSSL